MKDERNDIKEPYSPENTPNPPQIIDPSRKNEQDEDDAPLESRKSDKEPKNSKDVGESKPSAKGSD